MNLLPDAVRFLQVVKRAAVDAVRAMKPFEICFGQVTGISPLKILVDQKLPLEEKHLILTQNVTEYKTYISGGNIKNFYYRGEPMGEDVVELEPPHVHAIGKVQITVHNGLAVGEEVILLRQQGGQKYLVLGRVG